MLTNRQIAAALEASCGQVFLAAEKLGCPPKTIQRRIARSARLTSLIEASRGRRIDSAELALHRAVLDGQAWAIRLALSIYGKKPSKEKLTRADSTRSRSVLEKCVSVQQVLQTLIENDDYLDYCRSKHRAALPPQPEPPAAIEASAIPAPSRLPSPPQRLLDPPAD